MNFLIRPLSLKLVPRNLPLISWVFLSPKKYSMVKRKAQKDTNLMEDTAPPSLRHNTLCKQLKTTAVAKSVKTIYSSSPPLLMVCQSTINLLPLSVSQAVASCQTAAVVGQITTLPHTMSRVGCWPYSTIQLGSPHLTTSRSAKGQAGPSSSTHTQITRTRTYFGY